MKLTIGSDPELMLAKNGNIVSAIPVLEHGKYDKIDLGNDYCVYYDNTMVETNVPPASTKKKFLNNIRETFKRINSILEESYEILAVPSHSFTKEECRHYDAIEAGCQPEFCAYEEDMCVPPSFKDTFRSAGGHVHIGRSDYMDVDEGFLIDMKSKIEIIRAMDLFLGIPMVLIDNSEASIKRKELYGRGGRFRPTPYGVEYRTPSNFWLNSPVYAEIVYEATNLVFDLGKENNLPKVDVDILEIIDNDDVEKAQAVLESYIRGYSEYFYELVVNAIKHEVKNPKKEWKL